MRRNVVYILFLIVLVLILPAVAYAGVWGGVKDFVSANAVSGIIGLSLLLVGAIFKVVGISYKVHQLKPLLIRLASVYKMWKDAGEPDSPGGRRRTAEEYQKIIKSGMEAIGALITVLPTKWLPKQYRTYNSTVPLL